MPGFTKVAAPLPERVSPFLVNGFSDCLPSAEGFVGVSVRVSLSKL